MTYIILLSHFTVLFVYSSSNTNPCSYEDKVLSFHKVKEYKKPFSLVMINETPGDPEKKMI